MPSSADRFANGGDSQNILQDIELAVRSNVNLLIIGGDPLVRRSVALWVHRQSDRGGGPFVVIDQLGGVEWLSGPGSGLPGQSRIPKANQLEAWVDSARGGTLLLEEVADLSWAQQTELLQFLERRITEPRASQADASPGVRIVSGTRYQLLDRIASTQFHPDLFYRLNVICLVVPPGMAQMSEPIGT
jgi:DNA-binding NtrC family response regulator